ncbi:hypothetical protein EYF80_004035 [Liparis tanakae]|uniref:Uncharacterized protein n=1 Tax=Liparis tanakae TaxID=230148 RepID=A0A4Z2J7X3_9TELE|nr:hypothetical protein EYF80_004035 [Liparis tanakae]
MQVWRSSNKAIFNSYFKTAYLSAPPHYTGRGPQQRVFRESGEGYLLEGRLRRRGGALISCQDLCIRTIARVLTLAAHTLTIIIISVQQGICNESTYTRLQWSSLLL